MLSFSPLLVVAAATLLSDAASASPFLVPRADAGSINITDPHAAPAVPANYTSPLANGGEAWAAAFSKAQELVAQMTTEEKTNITSGIAGPCVGNTAPVPRFDIPSFCLMNGPIGVSPVDGVTQFPAGVTAAATWDRALIEKRAHAMGVEFVGKGIHNSLGPATGGPLGRSPLGGRAWESFSADVYLNTVASGLSVKGQQEAGVATCAKHFIAYEQEGYRSSYSPSDNKTAMYQQINSVLDEKTMHEVYLPSFAESVRQGASSVMSTYNSVNGIHASESEYLLNTLLKGELNFQGYVVSDWGGSWSTVKSAAYGQDMEMPGSGYGGALGNWYGEKLANATTEGALAAERLDDMVLRILTVHLHLNHTTAAYPATSFDAATFGDVGFYGVNEHIDVQADHWEIAHAVAEQSATLLKNVDTAAGRGLPIDDSKKLRIGVFGDDAGIPASGLSGAGSLFETFDNASVSGFSNRPTDPKPTWNGTIVSGGGSGSALAPYVISPLEGISTRARRTSVTVDFELSKVETKYLKNVASIVDKAVVFVNAVQGEGSDRTDLKLAHDADALINAVASYCSDTIVVIHSGQTVDMEAWAEHENVTAIVFAYYPGQESGAAIASVLFGDVSPSGKLPFTVGKSIDDYPGGAGSIVVDDVFEPTAYFDETVFIDYKWFDAKNITPRFPFGAGLSYSTFAFANATVAATPAADADYVQLTNEVFDGATGLYDVLYTVSASVTNTGNVTAAEVPQLYMTWPATVTDQPPKSLRGFEKATLVPGETRTFDFRLKAKDLAVYDANRATWTIPAGEYTFAVGPDSRTLPISVSLQVGSA